MGTRYIVVFLTTELYRRKNAGVVSLKADLTYE